MGALVLLVELIFGAWLIPANQLNFFGVSSNMDEYIEVSNLTGPPVVIHHTRDRHGLRGQSTFNQPEKIDILTIGGSTTFQQDIDDADTWQEHLEAKLKSAGKMLTISNAGINGHSTHAHIKAFDTWFSTIEGLQPRYILFYIGVNDYLPRPFLLGENVKTNRLKSTLQDKSAIYNALRRAKGAYLASKNDFDSDIIDFSKYEFTEESLLTEAYREFYLNEFVPAFKTRLQKLIALSQAMGAEPVFITQPMAFYRYQNGALVGVSNAGHDFVSKQPVSGSDTHELITYLNEAMHEVALGYKVVDLTDLQVWSPTDFRDWIHNSSTGTEKVAHEIWKQLGDYLK